VTAGEGVVRYRARHLLEPLPPSLHPLVAVLDGWRTRLQGVGLIGHDGARYGGAAFGNVSARLDAQGAFLVTGTQTGGLARTDARHYAVVRRCDEAVEGGEVESAGPIPPSSEAMSHAALYGARPEVAFVFHGHAPDLWRQAARLGLPSTPPGAEYGTVAMARALRRLLEERPAERAGVLAMGGHEDGVLAWGSTADEAGQALLAALALARERLERGVPRP
jgi:ribulose-5-phosphate 4-epimerase/fuculose-1-phosphate aldolase